MKPVEVNNRKVINNKKFSEHGSVKIVFGKWSINDNGQFSSMEAENEATAPK